ncbi:unnamed protein product [Dicrocoelium dendriticum]|nr:unnamed protein product [Dicrocoelium dendriticum]
MTAEELHIYKTTPPLDCDLYFAPLVWALDMITEARREGLIRFDRAVEILTEEVTRFRGKVGNIFAYDWINIPLVYTQVSFSHVLLARLPCSLPIAVIA